VRQTSAHSVQRHQDDDRYDRCLRILRRCLAAGECLLPDSEHGGRSDVPGERLLRRALRLIPSLFISFAR